ncbi:MAG: type II toxin-antitoxin system RelE/ParE family toxin [Candidatus Aminicenantes bacterium]|nr:type II toxin-antitoxin system RelE/ParE family toxin [Candidatus Aminicenantes bacterium]
MTLFSVRLTDSAAADLDKISPEARRRLVDEIRKTGLHPFPPDPSAKKLKGFRPSLYRRRAGDFRILYRVEAETVFILRVINRRDLERILRRLHL